LLERERDRDEERGTKANKLREKHRKEVNR
jgi:hypothetical protein